MDIQHEIDSVWTDHHGRVEADNTGYAPKTVWKWNKMVTRDEEGNFVFPEGMCEIIHSADVGYGPTEDYPCADRALYTVHYRDFYPTDHEGGLPVECTESVCGRCIDLWTVNLPDTIQFMFNRPYEGKYDGQYIEDKS